MALAHLNGLHLCCNSTVLSLFLIIAYTLLNNDRRVVKTELMNGGEYCHMVTKNVKQNGKESILYCNAETANIFKVKHKKKRAARTSLYSHTSGSMVRQVL